MKRSVEYCTHIDSGSTTDTLSQLGSTLPKLLESDVDSLPSAEQWSKWSPYSVYPLTGFKAVIIDERIKQVGHHCNDPISLKVKMQDRRLCETLYRQKRYATLTGVQDVFQIYKIPAYETGVCLEESAPTYCHSLGKLIIQSHRTTASIKTSLHQWYPQFDWYPYSHIAWKNQERESNMVGVRQRTEEDVQQK
jgi:hypothetical protein